MSSDYLIIPRIKIHNANALSSPYTIGFPAMTAWLGAVHALQRKLKQGGLEIDLSAVGVVSHQFDLQTYQGPGDFVYSIIGTANPVDKTGARPAFIEEARCHLTVSLIIEIPELTGADQDSLKALSTKFLNSGMKLAGGDILQFDKVYIANDEDKLKLALMPGYAIRERRDLMIEAMEQGQDAIDALLSFLTVRNEYQENRPKKWQASRKEKGWLVPIATGFQGISELGSAKNQRDPDTPHRFAESIVTLGEFVMPYRIKNISDLLWEYHTDLTENLYLCQPQAEAQSF